MQLTRPLPYRPAVDMTDGVAARLAMVCVDGRGRLRRFDIWDAAARGAILVDLVLAGRLVDEPDRVTVDPVPTGFAPADRFLAATEVEAGASLTWWIDHAPVRMRDVAAACVAAGRWTARRTLLGTRYALPEQPAPDPSQEQDPVVAAVEVLATACGARGHRPEPVDERELASTGSLRWICATVTDHLTQAHRRNLGAAGAADGGTVPYY